MNGANLIIVVIASFGPMWIGAMMTTAQDIGLQILGAVLILCGILLGALLLHEWFEERKARRKHTAESFVLPAPKPLFTSSGRLRRVRHSPGYFGTFTPKRPFGAKAWWRAKS